MPDVGKRPCCVCGRWFRPDPRIGARQRACRQPECQVARRRRKQKAWREANSDYFIARRMQKRAAESRPPEPLRLPPPLNQLPWDIAQSQFGIQGADFIGNMGTLLLRAAQSQFEAYMADSTGVIDTVVAPATQSQIRPVRESVRVASAGDETGISPIGPPL